MIRRLAGQTAIYGIPSIVGRLINFILVFVFTEYFTPEIFSAHVQFYAYAAFLLVVLPHGMETAFFNFLRKDRELKNTFTTAFLSVLGTALFFLILVLLGSHSVANFMNYPDHPEYVRWFGLILFFDVAAMVPFALLRHTQKAGKFAMIRSLGILVNVALIILFVIYFPKWFPNGAVFYDTETGIGYVFIANLISSAFMFLMLLPDVLANMGIFDKRLWKDMLRYGWPLILVGLAGIVNETFDRVALDRLLNTDNPRYETGVYGAFYKLSIIITIFIQAFRYAAEPFFFERAKGQDAREVYAEVMNYFVWVCVSIALFTLLFLDLIAPMAIRSAAYFEDPHGMMIVAPLLLANIFLGIVYNLSIWYKVEDKNKFGAMISVIGAVITIVCLLVFVPVYGFIAAAYTTLAVYFTMAVLSYLLGRKYYPVPYNIGKITLLFLLGALLYLLDGEYLKELSTLNLVLKTTLGLLFILVGYGIVIRAKKT